MRFNRLCGAGWRPNPALRTKRHEVLRPLLHFGLERRCAKRCCLDLDAPVFWEFDVVAGSQEILVERKGGRVTVDSGGKISTTCGDANDASHEAEPTRCASTWSSVECDFSRRISLRELQELMDGGCNSEDFRDWLRWHRFVRHDRQVSFLLASRKEGWARLLTMAGIPHEAVTVEHRRPGRLCVGRWK